MMSEQQFDRKLEAIEAERLRLREGADAYRDQEMARLFERSGWSQERIAGRMGKSQQWVGQRLCFARFLAFTTTGSKTDLPLETLTERRFRKCWALTDHKVSERERFAHVATLLTDAPGPDTAHPNTVNKPGIRKAVVESLKGQAGWLNVAQLAASLDPDFPGIQTKQLSGALQDVQRKPPKGYAVEARHIGRIHQYRMVPRAEVGADAAELIVQVRPVLGEIKAELRKSAAAMSTTFLLERVAYIEKVLSHLREQAAAV